MGIGITLGEEIDWEKQRLVWDLENLPVDDTYKEAREKLAAHVLDFVDFICRSYEAISVINTSRSFEAGRELGRDEYRVLAEDVADGLFESCDEALSVYIKAYRIAARSQARKPGYYEIVHNKEARHALYEQVRQEEGKDRNLDLEGPAAADDGELSTFHGGGAMRDEYIKTAEKKAVIDF